MSPSSTVVAIDGPAASGKSTVARLVAQKLGFLYVDSGAMYRAVTWKALQLGIPVEDPLAVIGMLHIVKIGFQVVDQTVRVLVDGIDPGDALRTPEVSEKVSIVAAIPEVRQLLVQHQRSLTRLGNLVMEGRDIGSVVFPDTPYKFYIDAPAEVRAQRRAQEYAAMNIAASAEGVAENLRARDRLDSSRATAPLQIALGAIVVDNSRRSAAETADYIVQCITGGKQSS